MNKLKKTKTNRKKKQNKKLCKKLNKSTKFKQQTISNHPSLVCEKNTIYKQNFQIQVKS